MNRETFIDSGGCYLFAGDEVSQAIWMVLNSTRREARDRFFAAMFRVEARRSLEVHPPCTRRGQGDVCVGCDLLYPLRCPLWGDACFHQTRPQMENSSRIV